VALHHLSTTKGTAACIYPFSRRFAYQALLRTKRFLIEAANTLFVLEGEDKIEARELASSDTAAPRLDPSFSPDGNLIAYIRHNDIWVQDIATADEKRLSKVNPSAYCSIPRPSPLMFCCPKDNDSNCKKGCGIAEYIMQEEFDRYTGYWWNPVVQGSKYRLLCAETDETHIPTFGIPEPGMYQHCLPFLPWITNFFFRN